MKINSGNIKNVVILGLVIVIILLQKCSGNHTETPTEPTIITKVETRYDTITKEVPTYIPKIVTKIVYNTDTLSIVQPVDTAAILADYFATYVYQDIQNFDSLNIQITDSISQNQIMARSVKYDLIYPTTVITQTEFINNREFYAGFGLTGTKQQLDYVGASLLYRTKKKKVFGVGIGLDSELQPKISTQFLWQLGN